MELASQSVSDLFLSKGGLDLHVAPPETALKNPVQDFTAEIIGLGGEKLNLYVPSEAIIEPISPAEEVLDENTVLTVTTHKVNEQETSGVGDAAQTNCSLSATEEMPNEIIEANSPVPDSKPTDTTEESATKSRIDMGDQLIGFSGGSIVSKDNGCFKGDTGIRKLIPPKKDRLDPLKMDMSKTPILPLSSSQLSLQCLECHIIFSDHKSKQRHVKMTHPSEYEQWMLGDSLFTCYVCDQCFTCSTELMAHQRTHTERLPFKCPICGEAFSRSTELTTHKKEHFSKQQGGYTCSECGKLYKTITLLRYHQRRHTGERPFICIDKECGKRFSMAKALQRHLKTHEEEKTDGTTNATPNTKKKKRGLSTKKYACSQCEESFKTAKSQLQHIKTKHNQFRAIPSSNSIVLTEVLKESLPVTTEIVHPPLLCMEPIGQVQQQIGPLGVEQIKKLIEKLGNVQKVNQLVILGVDQLPFQQQFTGQQQLQGLMQPLHFNFTEPTFQPGDLQQRREEPGHQERVTNGTEQAMLLESLEDVVAVEQEKTMVQDESTMISVECPEKATPAIETDKTKSQINEVHYEVVPELTENLVLSPELEARQVLTHPTEEQCLRDASDALETAIAASSISLHDFNSKPNEEDHVSEPAAIVVFENNTDLKPVSQKPEAAESLVEPVEHTGQGKLDDNQEFVLHLEEVDLKEITSSEDPNTQIGQHSVSNVQHDQDKPQLEQAPHSEADVPQSAVVAKDQILTSTEELSYVKKALSVKKKKSKRQVSPKSKFTGPQDEVVLKTSQKSPTLKMSASSKTQKKRDKSKSKKLIVCFGPRESKEKYSKRKLLQISKTSLYKDQHDIDSHRVAALAKNDTQQVKQKKKNQKHEKGRKAKHAAGHIRCLNVFNDPNVMNVAEETYRGKPKKRKFENQKDLVKKGKSARQDETSMTKKKKNSVIPEVSPLKKGKVTFTEKKVMKKNNKVPKRKEMDKNVSEPLTLDQIKQQAMLLLKGHKQPQLKVHKLDAKTTVLQQQLTQGQTTDLLNQVTTVLPAKQRTKNKLIQATSQKKKNRKTIGKKSKVEHKESLLAKPSTDGDQTSASSGMKQKVARKRKAPTKLDQEIALSPPYSQVIIGCHDCGKKFSEVSALQEHMASMHSENGVFQSVACEISDSPTVCPRANEVMVANAVHSNSFEIQVSTDWDVESEMREIGLGSRDEYRLSFPALNPSPSFPLTTNSVNGHDKGDDCHQEVYRENSVELCENSREVNHLVASTESATSLDETNGKKAKNQDDVEEHLVPVISEDQESMNVKEDLPSDVNLVMVEQNEASDHTSTPLNNCQKGSDFQDHKANHSKVKHLPTLQTKSPTNIVNTANLNPLLTEQPEVMDEEWATADQRVENQTKAMTRSRGRGRGSKGRGKRHLGKRNASESRGRKDKVMSAEDCQVVYELYSLAESCGENKEEETDENWTATNAITASIQPASEESTKIQEAIELKSATTAAAEELIEDGSLIQKPEEQYKNNISCSSNQQDENSVNIQDEMIGLDNPQPDLSSTVVKIEATPSVLTPHDAQSNEKSVLQGVQVIVVKAEDHHISEDPHVLQGNQHMQSHSPFQEKHLDPCPVRIISGSPTASPSPGKQCIFYPIKEEQREMLVEPPFNIKLHLNSEMPEERIGSCIATGLDGCQEIRVGCMKMHHNLYSGTEEDNAGTEQQSTEDFLEFLSQTSDTDDSDNFLSEPEAETHIMSCYHGLDSSGAKQQREKLIFKKSGRNFKNTDSSQAEGPKPIEYFVQYFSWHTWKEIATYTASKLPVTEKEVAQVVGIHIAMGTLKFPSLKLYWQDYTRVSLIADAMSASRFFELASRLRLECPRGKSPRSAHQLDTGLEAQRQSSESDERSRMSNSSQLSMYQDYTTSADPLWKVRAVVNRVQQGCRALRRTGNHGVDQYRLPLKRHPIHLLHHAVMVNSSGMVMDFNLRVQDTDREELVEKMVSGEKDDDQGMVFLCKPELSTPSMLEHLLEAGVRSAGKVGGARGQIGDEFVTSDGKLKLFRCHHGFMLSAVTKDKSRSSSLVSGFERAIKAANLNRDLRSLYRTPCTCPSPSAWPQSVLWDLIDLALVNSWLQYKQDQNHLPEPLSLMAFRLEVSKALILTSSIDTQDSSPPYLPSPFRSASNTATAGISDAFQTPVPDTATRYDGFGHWPEQLPEGQEARCRFGGCERTSRVRCLKCCVFLCISRNHNCFLKFHSQVAE